MATFLDAIGVWLSTLQKLDLAVTPIAMKFCSRRLPRLRRLEQRMALCEMMKFAQMGHAFCALPEDHTCPGGLHVVGGARAPRSFVSGDLGAVLGGYEEARAMRRLYEAGPTLARDTVDSIAFAPLNLLDFEPDLLVLACDTLQKTRIVLRALVYKTGRVWVSRSTLYVNCAWVYAYPYVSGEPNYVAAGLSSGMSRRKVMAPGQHLVTVPYDLFPATLDNLQEMPFALASSEGDEGMANALAELGLPPGPPPFFL